MRGLFQRLVKAPYLYISGVLLVLSFGFNVFGLGLYPGWFNGFENWSENYVKSTIDCKLAGSYQGGLVESTLNQGIPEERCKRYTSQLGLQGYVYADTIGNIENAKLRSAIFVAFQIASVLGTIFLLLLFIRFVKQNYGAPVSLSVSALFALSPWLMGFSDNLYWLLFFILLPFILTLVLYPKVRDNVKLTVFFYIALFVCFCLRFTNGYEYISTIVISSVGAIVYWEIKLRGSARKLITNAVIVCAVSLIAFSTVIGLHIISLKNDYGSFGSAVTAIKTRGEYRASDPANFFPQTITNFQGTVPVGYETVDHYISLKPLEDGAASPFLYGVILLINYLLLPVIQLPVDIKGLLGVLVQSFVVWIVGAFIALAVLRHNKKILPIEHKALKSAVLIGLLGVGSWFIIASGHAFEHAHINAITYFISLMPWVYTITSIGFVAIYKSWSQRRK